MSALPPTAAPSDPDASALHDRLLSNRSSRRKHEVHPPELDEVQRRILAAVDREGYATRRKQSHP